MAPRPLPMTKEEAGGPLDVILVTGDAYVDHPSWGVAVIGRWLQAAGYRVGVIAQPDWKNPDSFKVLGAPRLFFGITAGNMDTMVNKYTASRRLRSDDAYSPGGEPGTRPDRATIAYTSAVKRACPGVPVVVGGVEASLRRFAHFDYWQGKIRGSMLLDSKADLLVYGMGERQVVEIADRLKAGESIRDIHDVAGTAWAAGAKDVLPTGDDVVEMPSLEECRDDPIAFNRATMLMYRESNPQCGRPLIQRHGARTVVQNPPARTFTTAEMDKAHELPYTYKAHNCYRNDIPALKMMEGSVTVNRGCSGGCSFCALTIHQGKDVVSRSHKSVVREVKAMSMRKGFKGIINDLGGPTANMFHMHCTSEKAQAVCRRVSCLHPVRCKHYGTDHKPYLKLLREVRNLPGVRKVFVNSGIRYDLAALDPKFVEELALHHVPGQISVAPEHASDQTLHYMRKPGAEYFEEFMRRFKEATAKSGQKRYMVPYFQCAHPGTGPEQTIELALYMKRHGLRPRQVQMFMPTPGTISTAMYVSGVDPYTKNRVYVAKEGPQRDRQRALLFYWKREEAPHVREALIAWGRKDLIGRGKDQLVPPGPAYPRRKGSRKGRKGVRFNTHMGMNVERDDSEGGWESMNKPVRD